MSAAKLDTKIIISSRAITQDSAGAPIETLSTFATVWAQVTPVFASERFESGRILATKSAKFLIRFLTGVLETMKITHDSEVYQITGIAEVGRREYLQLTAEVVK